MCISVWCTTNVKRVNKIGIVLWERIKRSMHSLGDDVVVAALVDVNNLALNYRLTVFSMFKNT